MPPNLFFIPLRKRKMPLSVGNKAINLRRLLDKGLRVPVTYVCDWSAYHLYLENDANLISTLQEELGRIIDPDKAYAVRSSANIEDSLDRSFAGQFKSVLNVRGVDQIVQAMWSIWATATSPAVQAYLERHGIPTQQLSMAVIIQEMVPSVAAGVALSRNPVTGADEVIVEAVCGTGDALVQSGVSPCRWVNKWGNWLNKPEGNAIPFTLAEEIVDQTRRIASALKANVDLEWAWDGKAIYWLQVREITTLHHRNVFSNFMSKEMLPGMIKPLVWSVNIPLKSVVFVKFMNELLGETGINPEELIKSFYYRVYFNMGVIGQAFKMLGLPDDSLEMMMGLAPMGSKMVKPTPQMLIHLPRMVAFAHRQWIFHSRTQKILPDLERRIKYIHWQDAGRLEAQELLRATDQLYQLVQEVTYFNILCPILAVMHNRMFSNELKRLSVNLSQIDVTEGLPKVAEYDPATHLRRLHAAFEKLDPVAQEKIREGMYAGLVHVDGIQEFQKGIAAFIERFGYLSDNGNDFSCTPWRESPDIVLGLILDFKSESEEKSVKIRFADLKINFLRRPMLKLFYERVRTYRLLREQLSAQYTYTYGLFRYFYLAMGEYLVKHNVIDTPEDVFYLTDSDVRQMLTGQAAVSDRRTEVARHKAEMVRFQNLVLPTVIYGDEEPPIAERTSERLIGLATSLGHYTGPVKVVRGITDFGKVQHGDVLVIPYSDVGWTPLFARAGAVVAESGGLLSHSSIIAREYGIPAVVSVNGAMNLCDDMRVTVDGHKGEVIIHPALQIS
jgi:phosphohistidine swiveling domain-containing protein